MVRFKLDTSLATITTGKSLPGSVYDLIEWAESQGRVTELVQKAYERNPGNSELKSFAEEFLKPRRAK